MHRVVALSLLGSLMALGAPERAAADAEARTSSSPRGAEPAGTLAARGMPLPALREHARMLASEEPAARARAVHTLSHLELESLPSLVARLGELAKQRPALEAAQQAMTALRHAAGSRRADEAVDRKLGVLPLLTSDRSRATLAVVEPLLLLRSLEHMGGLQALVQLGTVMVLDIEHVWLHEADQVAARNGLALLPALIVLRSHEDSRVRSFAQRHVRALGMSDPEVATAIADGALAAQVVTAYSQPLDFSAMPVLVRLTAHEKLELRLAARAAVARFGRNAIWQLRTLYQEATSERADPSWDAERTARELYAALDQSAITQADRWIATGKQQLEAGDFDAMETSYDRVLAVFPWLTRGATVAPGYAALGAHRLAQDRLSDARDAFDRALRLDPHAPASKHWRAQLAFVDAELALSRGVIDLHGYERALGYDPSHEAARDALDRLSGARATRERMHKRAAAGMALGILLAIAVRLRRGRGRGGDLPARV